MSSKSGDKRTCMGKNEMTCVLLAIAVLSMSSKSGDKRTCMGKNEMTCGLVAI